MKILLGILGYLCVCCFISRCMSINSMRERQRERMIRVLGCTCSDGKDEAT